MKHVAKEHDMHAVLMTQEELDAILGFTARCNRNIKVTNDIHNALRPFRINHYTLKNSRGGELTTIFAFVTT